MQHPLIEMQNNHGMCPRLRLDFFWPSASFSILASVGFLLDSTGDGKTERFVLMSFLVSSLSFFPASSPSSSSVHNVSAGSRACGVLRIVHFQIPLFL